MTFCPNCGSQATGSFCPNCGTPLGGGASGTAGGAGYAPSSTMGVPAQGVSDNVAATLCYIPFFIGLICSAVFLIVAPYNSNRGIRFHAFQSLFLHLALFVISIALSILISIVALVTHGIGLLLGGLYPVLWLASLVLFLVMMYQTYNKQKIKLPVIGDFAEKQA